MFVRAGASVATRLTEGPGRAHPHPMGPMGVTPSEANSIAAVIGLSVAPVFLLAGIGAILNVMTQRLARVIDRARAVEDALEAGEGAEAAARHRRELGALARRMRLVNAAITACTGAALAVCGVVALLFLSELSGARVASVIAALFVGAMAALVAGLSLLLVEISVAMRTVRVRTELMMETGEA